MLGRPEIMKLGIIRLIGAINAENTLHGFEKFPPEIFEGIGRMKGDPYKIQLKEDMTPFKLTVPRKVPLPLYDCVKKELDHLESEGAIRKITEPTDWCAGMVVVPAPKRTNGIRVCVDSQN